MNAKLISFAPEKVEQARRQQSLKLWWLAEMSHIHPTTLRRWLQGRTRRARRTNMERLATTLSLSVSELMR